MSVIMMLRVKADAGKLQEVIGNRWQEINERARQHGCLRHQFLGSDSGEVLVLDEWESVEGFQAFFAASDDIRETMAEAGATSEPEITFWHPLDWPDRF